MPAFYIGLYWTFVIRKPIRSVEVESTLQRITIKKKKKTPEFWWSFLLRSSVFKGCGSEMFPTTERTAARMFLRLIKKARNATHPKCVCSLKDRSAATYLSNPSTCRQGRFVLVTQDVGGDYQLWLRCRRICTLPTICTLPRGARTSRRLLPWPLARDQQPLFRCAAALHAYFTSQKCAGIDSEYRWNNKTSHEKKRKKTSRNFQAWMIW